MALLEKERGKIPKNIWSFVRNPPYPVELLKMPYPKKYELPTFSMYDGRKRNTMEHVSKFLDFVGPHAGDPDF